MSEHYNQNYTEEEIRILLNKIKNCINDGQYTISKNRVENQQFMNDYNISDMKRKDILLNIEVTDFCHSLKNIKSGYEHEILYVFCPQETLFDVLGEEEFVDIYTKFNIIEYRCNREAIAISFHKRNKPIDYAFR
ncbi:MAG: hypothetical protein RR745_06585 [Bacilli bacterium]